MKSRDAAHRPPPFHTKLMAPIILVCLMGFSACTTTTGPPATLAGDTVGASCTIDGDVDFRPDSWTDETFLVANAPDCYTDQVCMVYEIEGDPGVDCQSGCAPPEEVEARVFCSCRCDGEPGTGPFCACPSGFTCEDIIEIGPEDVRGSYCVREGL